MAYAKHRAMMNSQYIRLDNRAMLSILRSLDGDTSLNQTQTEASLHASLHLLHENLMLRARMRQFLELDVQVTDLRFRAARAPQNLLRRVLRRTQQHVDPQQLVDQRDAAWRDFEMLRKLVDNTNRSLMVTPS